MKTFINLSGLLLCGFIASGQPIQFFAHEDHVKPSMNASYVDWLKKVKQTYQDHQVQMSYSTLVQDDNTYYFFTPMESFNLAGVYKTFSDVQSKLGKEAFDQLFRDKGKFIDSHKEFITQLLPQYSYLAPAEQEHFRHMMFWVPIDGMEAEVEQISKEWIELHRTRNSPNGYNTFKTVFGDEPGYVIVSWGKDQLDNVTKNRTSKELLGPEAAKLWARTMAITKKIYHKTGWVVPDLSYSYKEVTATNK